MFSSLAPPGSQEMFPAVSKLLSPQLLQCVHKHSQGGAGDGDEQDMEPLEKQCIVLLHPT